jgi:hypothetical protein
MNLLLLGGIGGVSLDASRDLIASGFEHVLLADNDSERAYHQDGRFHSVPPFSGEKVVTFP